MEFPTPIESVIEVQDDKAEESDSNGEDSMRHFEERTTTQDDVSLSQDNTMNQVIDELVSPPNPDYPANDSTIIRNQQEYAIDE